MDRVERCCFILETLSLQIFTVMSVETGAMEYTRIHREYVADKLMPQLDRQQAFLQLILKTAFREITASHLLPGPMLQIPNHCSVSMTSLVQL